jgi:hypothetical protein
LSFFINDRNSGSVFAQWIKAVETSNGEFLWIAEADDLSEPTFLSSLLALMKADASISLGFTDSKSIDAEGAHVYASYKPYFATIEPGALTRTEVFEGRDFATRYLSVKNTILNVSSVLWRREPLLRALEACRHDLKRLVMAGDWRIYLECLASAGAKIAYVADPLNVHRRHAASVTHSLKAQKHIEEIGILHGIARERFKLSKTEIAAQACYIEEVTTQLLGEPLKAGSKQEQKPGRLAKSASRIAGRA